VPKIGADGDSGGAEFGHSGKSAVAEMLVRDVPDMGQLGPQLSAASVP
jgi:hypothetical protein